MNDLYWITRLDAINGVMLLFGLISFVLICVLSILMVQNRDERTSYSDYEFYEDKRNRIDASFVIMKKYLKISIASLLFVMFVRALIPTTKEAYIILGVGGTIDYIRSDSTAKQIPHKAVLAIDKFLNDLEE